VSKKNLILLCDQYPVSKGEFFIDTEIKFLASRFNHIFVLIKEQEQEQEQEQLKRYIPSNLQVNFYKKDFTITKKVFALRIAFKKYFLLEVYNALFRFNIPLKILLFKIIFNYIYSSDEICKAIIELQRETKINLEETVLYSYWHDEKAFAIARLKKRFPKTIAISRAHGSDIYFEAQKFVSHKFPYLPFKEFIIKNLSKTYPVSIYGKKRFNQLFDNKYDNKLKVSYLGVSNPHDPLFNKENTEFTICSCSSIIPVKRLNLIVDIISHCNTKNLTWIHIGVGKQKDEIMNYIKSKIPQINVIFKGHVNNNDILKYYCTKYIDIFVNVSTSEGLPVSIMEAMSAAIPIMATNVGGTSDAIDKSIGFLLDKNFDVQDAARMIDNFNALPHASQLDYRKNSYQTWLNKFNSNTNYPNFTNEILNHYCPIKN
jgi:glycosyltransferase involved in cell wall biosynthesis